MAMCSPHIRSHREVALRKRPGILLHIDLRFEFAAIQLHIFVRIARIAVLAAEFAPAVRVHRPAERHPLRIALVQDRPNGQKKIFRPALGFRARGGGGEARNADQFRCGLRLRSIAGGGAEAPLGGLTIAVASGLGE